MRYFSGSGLIMTSAVLLTILVFATVMASDLEVEKKLSEKMSFQQFKTDLENRDISSQPHRRSKRTIGHIFDMFKNMMDGLFGGGKKKKRPNRPGSAYGPPKPPKRPKRPKNPSSGYGPPKSPPKRPTYGNRPPRPPPAPRPPPPPPRTPTLSGGYAGGNAPPRPQRPQAPNPDSYGSPVAPPAPRAPSAPNPDSYGSPVAPLVPQAPRVPNPDSYGSPVAPPLPPRAAPAPDSYGSPVAPPLPPRTPQAPDSYGSPVAPPVPQAPRAPTNSYSAQPQAPRTPTGGSFGPSSVFYMIPAPNLATEGPQGAPAGGDSYGTPVAPPVRTPVSAPDSYGGPVSAPDSYGGPEPAPRAPPLDSYDGPDSYGTPVIPDSDYVDINTLGGRTAVLVPNPDNPFLKQGQYNNAAPLPVITKNDLQGEFVDEDGYGAPDGSGEVAPAPITDIDTPEGPSIIQVTREEESDEEVNIAEIGGRTDDLLADALNEEPVPDLGTDPRDEELPAPGIAPVEDATTAPIDEYEYLSDDGIDDAEYVVDLRSSSDEEEAPAPIQDLAPEGEVISTLVDETEGELSPLFENLRDVSFTSADSPTTPAIEQEPIQIDLSEGVADFTNGLDDTSGPSEIDLTTNLRSEDTDVSLEYDYSQDLQENYAGDTTPVPDISALEDEVLEYVEYETEPDYTEEDYVGNEDIPPELPDDLAEQANLDIRTNSEEYEESFGQPASSDLTEGDEEVEYEYYYDYEEDYEVDPEQLPDDNQDQRLGAYSPSPNTSPSTPITTGGINNNVENDIIDLRGAEEEAVRSGLKGFGETNFISVPLMIEEVQKDSAPLIFAGTSGDLSGFADSGEQKVNAKRRAPHAFHPVFQGWNLAAESPQAKRQSEFKQSDWSQRIASARRNRVWRQFNLD